MTEVDDHHFTSFSIPDVVPLSTSTHLLASSPKKGAPVTTLPPFRRSSTRGSLRTPTSFDGDQTVQSSIISKVEHAKEDLNTLEDYFFSKLQRNQLSSNKNHPVLAPGFWSPASTASSASTNSTPNLGKAITKNGNLIGKLERRLERLKRQQHEPPRDEKTHVSFVEDSNFELSPPSEFSDSRPSSEASLIEDVRAASASTTSVHRGPSIRLAEQFSTGSPIQRRHAGTVTSASLRRRPTTEERGVQARAARSKSLQFLDEVRVAEIPDEDSEQGEPSRYDRSAQADLQRVMSETFTFATPMPRYSVPKHSSDDLDVRRRVGERIPSVPAHLPPAARPPPRTRRDLFTPVMDVDSIPKKKPQPGVKKLPSAVLRPFRTGTARASRKPEAAQQPTSTRSRANSASRGSRSKSSSASPKKKLVPFITTAHTGQQTYSLTANRQQVLALLQQYFPHLGSLRREVLIADTKTDVAKRFQKACQREMEELDEKYKADLDTYERTDDIEEQYRLDRNMDRYEKTYDALSVVIAALTSYIGSTRPLSQHTESGGIVQQLRLIHHALAEAFAI